MRKPHGPATERRAKILAILTELLATPEAERPRKFDPAGVAAKQVKVQRRTVLAVARSFDVRLPRKVSPSHKLARVNPAEFLADVESLGAAKVARRLRCSPQAVYAKAHALRAAAAAP